jgi:hypothetical protein
VTGRLARELKRDVTAIALPEGRVVGSDGLEKVKRYLVGRMEELGLRPHAGDRFELPYSHGGEEFANLVGIVRPRRVAVGEAGRHRGALGQRDSCAMRR